ncbi:MAG: hypothetical protein HDR88_07305 [Bacteroides sp.]|nr:hypothetical protein [Bacteroides sp.]
MKISLFRLISLTVALVPLMATAQTNIQSAFDAIINCPKAEVTDNHTLDKDPVSNIKIGQSDVYHFVLPANKINLVKDVVSAFDKDSERAYRISRGKVSNTDEEIQLSVGDASTDGVYINEPGCEYIYALFLPSKSEDPEGIFRYAYGINFKEEDGKLIGKLAITYATTLKYRQQVEQERQLNLLNNYPNGAMTISPAGISQQTWFDMFMNYFQNIPSASPQTRIALATKAYKLTQFLSQHPEVAAEALEASTNISTRILKDMFSDKESFEKIINHSDSTSLNIEPLVNIASKILKDMFSDKERSDVTLQSEYPEVTQEYIDLVVEAFQEAKKELNSDKFSEATFKSNYPEVSPADIEAAREILKGMISDKEYSETVLNRLLNQCLKSLN